MISVEIEKNPDHNWNKRLLGSQYGTVYQTQEYGLYLKSQLKFNPVFLKFYTSKGGLVGQLLIFKSFAGRRKIAKFFGRGFVYSTITKASVLFPKYINWYFGPVIFDTSYQKEISESLGNLLISWKSKLQGTPHPLDTNFNFAQKFNFKNNGASTIIIDLNESINEIFNNTDKNSVQKNIKRSQERGVTITQISSKEELKLYYELLNKHRTENKLVSYSLEDVIKGYEIVKPVGQIGFLAWHEKIAVGGIFISTFNKYINEWGIARSMIDTEKKLSSLDLLRWKIIEWGKQNDCKYYDLSGVKSGNRSPKEESLFKNKAKWGGKLIEYSSFSNF